MPTPRIAPSALALLFSLPLAGCGGCQDPTTDKPHATVLSAAPATSEAPATTTAAAPVALGDVTVEADPAQSKFGFIGSKKTMSHPGEFTKFKGSITLKDGKPEGGKISLEIDMDSVKTDNEKVDKHLKTDDFFDVAKYPTATFTSTEIKPGGSFGNSHTITGELKLHGVTKALEFPATIKVEGDSVTVNADFAITRTDWKINYKGKLDDLIRPDVLIKVTLKGPIKKG